MKSIGFSSSGEAFAAPRSSSFVGSICLIVGISGGIFLTVWFVCGGSGLETADGVPHTWGSHLYPLRFCILTMSLNLMVGA